MSDMPVSGAIPDNPHVRRLHDRARAAEAEVERLRKALLDATLTIGHRDHELRVVKAHEASLLEALIHRDHEVEHLRAEIGRLRPVAEGLGAEAYRLREFIREVRDADDTELLGIRARAREALAP